MKLIECKTTVYYVKLSQIEIQELSAFLGYALEDSDALSDYLSYAGLEDMDAELSTETLCELSSSLNSGPEQVYHHDEFFRP
jgi:hypothetical protein